MTDRRFIEERFPVKEVGIESAREKSIRHGHISTLHLWWARRPLAASRATIYAALIPAPATRQEANIRRKEIAQLSRWENPISTEIINTARRRIREHHGSPPKVLDPFAGGGSIPLEASRLGCQTYASDYNPVANLIVKATIEYPFLYKSHNQGINPDPNHTKLVTDVKKWSKWVVDEARKEIAQFFLVGGGGWRKQRASRIYVVKMHSVSEPQMRCHCPVDEAVLVSQHKN